METESAVLIQKVFIVLKIRIVNMMQELGLRRKPPCAVERH